MNEKKLIIKPPGRMSNWMYVFGILALMMSVPIFAQTTTGTPGEDHHLYLKLYNYDDAGENIKKIEVKQISADPVNRPFSYSYQGHVDKETATLWLFDLGYYDNGSYNGNYEGADGFHAQWIPMNPAFEPDEYTVFEEGVEVVYPFRPFVKLGISWGDFQKTYSLNNGKLFYDKGFVEVNEEDVIDFYLAAMEEFLDESGNIYFAWPYQLIHNGEVLECGEFPSNSFMEIAELRKAFVSTYGRPNNGGEIDFLFEPYNGDILGCEDVGCMDFYKANFVPNSNTCSNPTIEVCPSTSEGLVNDDNDELLVVETGTFNAYPNPATNRLSIQINPVIDETISINILDAMGRVVLRHQQDVNASTISTTSLDITDLVSGLYYIQIDSEYKFETKKITVLK